ncbi:glucokinase [Raphidocelis subcapitata]|uniref:Glucokinase n=1 Tax=Raphidocelis subcapitata TaxID=307507 RepID=A0A2V0PGK1_9CHLO|nr:glucokinase [Raphidocelis subcapitata]|eukprot:GBF98951.1 glucokinase [Raphidocelis subcapitata]
MRTATARPHCAAARPAPAAFIKSIGRPSHARARSVTVRAESAAAPLVLTGDIGGTNARLSIWQGVEELTSETYPTSQFPEFEDAFEAFLEVSVLNDFEAVGYGVPALGPGDVVPLNPNAAPVAQAPKCVMGPGTGLGAAQLFWDTGRGGYTVVPGEGAHATFAPRGWRQQALAAWVTSRLGHCEIEEVACGRGLELIYEFLISDDTRASADGKPLAKLSAPEITARASEADPLASEAVEIFLSVVGAEAGAMALRSLARGGVYIAGGIVPRLMERAGALRGAFLMPRGRERFQGILQSIPLYVVTNTKVGIIGSREYALRSLAQRQ